MRSSMRDPRSPLGSRRSSTSTWWAATGHHQGDLSRRTRTGVPPVIHLRCGSDVRQPREPGVGCVRVNRERALPWDKVPSYGSLAGDTVYVAAVDAEGNAASLIFSLYGVFGSCVTSAETGVTLQNRGAYFSLDPKHPNRLEPGKVPLHTLIASLAFKDEKLWAVLGCMGADGQPQIHLQTYIAMVDFGQDIQQALAGPRWLSGRFGLGEARDTLHIEARFPRQTIDELERRGHPVDRWGDWNELAGHAHGITRDPRTGLLAGGFDPRSDGAAIGF